MTDLEKLEYITFIAIENAVVSQSFAKTLLGFKDMNEFRSWYFDYDARTQARRMRL